MKTNIPITKWLTVLTVAVIQLQLATVRAQSTAFSYQGRLINNGSPANGLYDVRFGVWDAPTNGDLVTAMLTNSATGCTNGLFAATLDFGTGVFTGPERWLQLDVRTNGTGTFTALLPRQPILPIPYAIYSANAGNAAMATNAGTAGSAISAATAGTANHFSGSLSGDVTGTQGATVVAKVGGQSAASVAGGANAANAATSAATANTIVKRDGSGTVTATSFNGSGSGITGLPGSALAANPTFTGTVTAGGDLVGSRLNVGSGNSLGEILATIAGGQYNTINNGAQWATISGGLMNTANGQLSIIGGGMSNTNLGNYATIGGGIGNTIKGNGSEATIPGGYHNIADWYTSFAAGSEAQALHSGAFVWADFSGGPFASTGNNQFLIRARGNVGINKNNPATALDVNGVVTATSFSGSGSGITDLPSSALAANPIFNGTDTFAGVVIATNTANQLGGTFTGTLSGNMGNFTAGNLSVLNLMASGTLYANLSSGWVTAGEINSSVVTSSSFIGNGGNFYGGNFYGNGAGLNSLNASNLVSGTVPDSRLSGNVALLNTSPTFSGSVTAASNLAGARLLVGSGHTLNGSYNSIAGGINSTIQAGTYNSTIAGGDGHTIHTGSSGSTIGGGIGNQMTGVYSIIAGGYGCSVINLTYYSVIGGGYNNTVAGTAATIPGGFQNSASGNFSLAAGYSAKATNNGAFVWADSAGGDCFSSANNQFTVRASGGTRFFSDAGASVGVQLAAGGNAWSALSDRSFKENFQPVDTRLVLDKVAHLPVTEWNLKSQPALIRHLGPMAQDFKAAFGLGEDDRHISTSDVDGVALAAIQGLNQKLDEKDAEIQHLKQSLAELQQLVQTLVNKK